jgi:ABC-type Fe3+-siderophore transport system permease subunit
MRAVLDASHGPIFAIVAMLVASLLSGRRRSARASTWPDWPLYLKALAISVALGALIEFLQGFEGRPPSFFDVLTDTAGTLGAGGR